MTEREEERLRVEFNRWAREGYGLEPRHPGMMEKVFRMMQVQPKDRVIDLGCGAGWATRQLARLASEGVAVGLDVSDEMVALARQQSVEIENVMFVLGAADEIPWQEDFFSLLLSVDSAFYWPDLEAATHEIFRVMAPGGRIFILNTFYRESPLASRWQQVFQVPVHLKSVSEWSEVFTAAGFEAVQISRVTDETPVEADFEPSPFYASPEEKAQFRRTGALLIQAAKPGKAVSHQPSAVSNPEA